MRIGIIGTGISGLTCAHLLSADHELVIYESGDHIGGHAHTVDVEIGAGVHAVDTGFIVFNDRSYPGFTRLLERVGVERQPTEMSFSVCSDEGLEYGGGSLDALFAQRRNLLRPSFLRMCADIGRFYRDARAFLADPDPKTTLGDLLTARRYSAAFVEQHLLPMGAAIWSTDLPRMRDFPAQPLLRFFENHGLLQLSGRPQWFTVPGGSRTYVDALTRPFRDSIHLRRPVRSVRRGRDWVEVADASGRRERFSHVIVATHSDQALRLLADASPAEREILGAIRYQPNEVVLHTDASLLPRSRRAWSSWNYHLRADDPARVCVTYHMNRLQLLDPGEELCVTLNGTDRIDPDRILRRFSYDHPLFDLAALRAQGERAAIDGVGRTHFCGAYWGNGFHEDGVTSALEVCRKFGRGIS